MRPGGEKQKGEQWKPVNGFPGYAVSNFGQIESTLCGAPRVLRPNKANNLVLRRSGESCTIKVAQLVLLAFVGPPPPNKRLARHLDDDRTNNRLSNLAWGSHQDNYNDGVRNGRHGSGTPGAQLRGKKLKGRTRSNETRAAISRTKQLNPHRQRYGDLRDDWGRFTAGKATQ
jgi:hypothetical protein